MRRNFFVYFVLFFIVSVTTFGLIFSYRQDANKKKRTEDLRQLAARLGFVFAAGNTDLGAGFGRYGFSAGFGRNTMIGSLAGQLVAVTDYVIVHQSRSVRSERVRTLVIFPDGAAGLPNFVLYPGGYWKKTDDRTNPPIVFAKTDKFAALYTVRGTEAPAIQSVFSAKTRAFFSTELAWTVQIHDGRAIVSQSDRVVAPEDVSAYIADARKVIDAFRLR